MLVLRSPRSHWCRGHLGVWLSAGVVALLLAGCGGSSLPSAETVSSLVATRLNATEQTCIKGSDGQYDCLVASPMTGTAAWTLISVSCDSEQCIYSYTMTECDSGAFGYAACGKGTDESTARRREVSGIFDIP